MNIIDFKGDSIRVDGELSNNSKLAVFYPGYAYTLKAPVLFYLQELFAQKGFDIVGIDYRYYENTGFLNASAEEKDTWFEYDCSAIGKEINEFAKAYKRVVYIGKSLGTTMLMHQLKSGLIEERAELVFLTPGVYVRETYNTILKIKNRVLVVYGDADKYYNKTDVKLIRDRKDTLIKEIKNAGHIFEEAGSIRQSIVNIAEVVEAVDDFVGNVP